MTTTPVEWLGPTAYLGASDNSTRSRLIQLADGRLLAAISTADSSGEGSPAGSDVLGRIYDAAGQPLGDFFRLNNQSTAAEEYEAEITALPGGGFSVAYTRLTFGGFPLLPDTDIVVETYDATGTRISNLTVANGSLGGTTFSSPHISALSDTRALVTWTDSNDDVRAQIINPTTGATVAGAFTVFNGGSGAGEGLNGMAMVALTQSSQYLVAMGDRDTAGNDELYFKLVSSSGAVGALVTVNDASVDIGTPAVTELTNGRFAITWMREAGGGNDEEVRLRIYNSNGTAHTGVLNPQASATGSQLSPAIAATDGGGVVVFWHDFPTSSVIGQRYDAAGVKVGTVFTVQDLNATENRQLQATRLDDGRISLTWLEDFSSGGDIDSRFAIWDPRDAANAPDANGIIAGTASNDVIAVTGATTQVFAGRGADSIEVDLADIPGLTTLDGGSGSDEIRIGPQAGTFDLRPVWIAYNEELEFAGGANLIRTLQVEALDVAFLGEVDFDGSAGSSETVQIHMGTQSTLNLTNVVYTDLQAGLDSLVVKGDGTAETITGSAQGDTLEGGGANDTLFGGAGDDTLEGGNGADSLNGNGGADTVSYAGAVGAVTVNLATQTASGGIAAGDTIASFVNANGGSGNDALFGSTSANTLRGNGGDDILDGDAGADSLDGGAGNDTFWIDDGDAVAGDVIQDLFGGNDQIRLIGDAGGPVGQTIQDLRPLSFSNIERLTFGNTIGDSRAQLNATQVTGLTHVEGFAGLGVDETLEIFMNGANVLGLSGVTFVNWGAQTSTVWVNGGVANETVAGAAQGRNLLYGGAGNDRLTGGQGDDQLYGGTENDTLFGGAGINDTGSGNDTLAGGAGNDTLYGDNGNDSLYGDQGNDTLSGGSGNDLLDGGTEDDRLWSDIGADSLIGGSGNDTADFSGSSAGVTVNLTTGTGLGGDAQGDTFATIEHVVGSSHDDVLTGDGAANSLTGSSGNDTLSGAAGNDTLYGGLGNDTLDGGTENDLLTGGAGADSLYGGAGINTASYSASDVGVTVRLWNGTGEGGDAQGDVLAGIEWVTGSAQTDSLIGADIVNNLLDGGAGADYLNGLSGNDTLLGGAGNDTLTGAAGADLLDGQGDTDWADYTGAVAGVLVRLWNGTGENGDAAGDVLTQVENLRGGTAGDTLIGSDVVGNVLEGAAGADYLNGLSGNDTLSGGSEADILDGAAGADRLDGGTGADDFVFGTGSGADVVTLFEDGSDQVDLTGVLTFASLTLTTIAGGVRVAITATPTDTIDLMGVTLGQVTAGDFI